MKNIFKKPFWIGASVVLATTAVVTPAITLSSCSAIKRLMIDEVDHETGTSSYTYDSMKKEFRSKYITKLRNVEKLSEEEIAERLVDFDNYISQLDSTLKQNQPDAVAMDYTSLTIALSEVASTKYNIFLGRTSNINWNDFYNQYKGLRESTKTYMVNHQIDPIEADILLKDCDKRFDTLLAKLSDEYDYDPLLGYVKGQNELLTVFNENNAEVALVASINRLSDFTSQYSFEFREDAPAYAYYDNLKEYLDEPDPERQIEVKIPKTVMNDVFVCKEVQTGNVIDFDNKMLPGYIITPYLQSWYEDKYSNQYAMEIDWQIYPSAYDQQELRQYKDLVTAHVYGENEQIQEGEITDDSPFNETMQQSKIVTNRYYLEATADYEQYNLQRAYFNSESNGDKVSFAWAPGGPDNKDNKYEPFFDGVPENSYSGTLEADSLANSGLRIGINGGSYEPLSTVMERMELEDADPEHARPDEELSLTEKFVKYCTLKSNVSIDDSYGAGHKVGHQFFYVYNNSKKGDAATYYETDERRSDGFLVSNEFFDVANTRYVEGYQLYKRYLDNGFIEIKHNSDDLEASFAATTAMTAVQIAKNVAKMFLFSIAAKLIAAYTIALLTSNAAVLGIMWSKYKEWLVNPIDDFIANTRKFRNDPCFLKMQERLAQDQTYFCLPDDEGRYVGWEYNAKRKSFQEAPFVTVSRPLFQYYSTLLNQDNFVDFKNKAKFYHVDPKTFRKKFGTWMYTGKCYLMNYGYSGIRMVLNQLLLPQMKCTWLQFLVEFGIEYLIGKIFTKILKAKVFNWDYDE